MRHCTPLTIRIRNFPDAAGRILWVRSLLAHLRKFIDAFEAEVYYLSFQTKIGRVKVFSSRSSLSRDLSTGSWSGNSTR